MSQQHAEGNGHPGLAAGDVLVPLPAAVAQALQENGEAVGRALALLGRMEREGTLQELVDVLALLKLLKDALTDEMVIGIAGRVERLAAMTTDPSLVDLAGRLAAAVRQADEEARAEAQAQAQAHAGGPPSPPSLMALARQLRDPQVRRGLAYMLRLVKHLAPGAS